MSIAHAGTSNPPPPSRLPRLTVPPPAVRKVDCVEGCDDILPPRAAHSVDNVVVHLPDHDALLKTGDGIGNTDDADLSTRATAVDKVPGWPGMALAWRDGLTWPGPAVQARSSLWAGSG